MQPFKPSFRCTQTFSSTCATSGCASAGAACGLAPPGPSTYLLNTFNPPEIFLNILKNILLDGKRMTDVVHTIKITTELPNNSASITRSCTFRLFTRLIRLLSSGVTVMQELTPKREYVDAC